MENLDIIMGFALRYSFNRNTSASSIVSDFIKENIDVLNDNKKQLMLDDINDYIKNNVDKNNNYKVLKDLSEFLSMSLDEKIEKKI